MFQYKKTIRKLNNYDGVTKENTKDYRPYLPQILDGNYKILIIGASGSEKTNALYNKIMIIIVLLMKFVDMLRIQMKQNIKISLKSVKKIMRKTWKIQRLSSNIKIMCKMSIETLKSTNQIGNVMYYQFLMI